MQAETKSEILEILVKMDIAFAIDFLMILATKSFITVSMHWITWDWRLKTCILGKMHVPKKHAAANISDRLLNAHIDFDLWPKDARGRIPESEEALRCEKLAYFGLELPLDRLVLTSDCGRDVSAGALKDNLCN